MPEADTTFNAEFKVDTSQAHPGQELGGEVHLTGGSVPETVPGPRVLVHCRNPTHWDDDLGAEHLNYLDEMVAPETRVPEFGSVRVPFRIRLPWNVPLTEHRGAPLAPISLDIRMFVDRDAQQHISKIYKLRVEPLPSQLSVLDAAAALGAKLRTYSLWGEQTFVLADLPGRGHWGPLLRTVTTEHTLMVNFREDVRSRGESIELAHADAITAPWESRLREWLRVP